MKRLHRTVVLPDYQGIGIGKILRNEICEKYSNDGFRVTTTTSHPAMISSMKRDKNWRCTRVGRASKIGKTGDSAIAKTTSTNRITTSWEYRS